MQTLRPGADRPGIPLNLFTVPLALAGTGGAWSEAAAALSAPAWPDETLYAVASATWVLLLVAYVVGRLRRRAQFGTDLRHPQLGPFAAVIPLIAVLLAAHYSRYDFALFSWVCAAAIVALIVVAAQLIAHWMVGGVELNAIHPGYFIPVVAGANVASIGLSTIRQHELAIGAFGAGLFFYLLIGSGLLVRFFLGGRLQPGEKPGLSGFVAAAATSNLAWIISHPGPIDQVQLMLTGVLVVMIVVLVFLVPEFRTLPFGFAWWIFLFPLGSTSNYVIRWADASRVPGWTVCEWCVLGVATAFFLYVALRSLLGAVIRSSRRDASSAPVGA